MFLHVFVCPQEGCLPHCMLGYTPWADNPSGQAPPWADTPPGSLGTNTPGHKHPWADTPGQAPPCTVHTGIWSTSGRYASLWNAILLWLILWRNASLGTFGERNVTANLAEISYYILLGIRYYIFSYVLGKDFRLYLHSSISQFSLFSFHWSDVPMRDNG